MFTEIVILIFFYKILMSILLMPKIASKNILEMTPLFYWSTHTSNDIYYFNIIFIYNYIDKIYSYKFYLLQML